MATFDTSEGSLTIDENQVDLSPLYNNTDNQTLSLTGTTLSISNGNSVVFENWDTDVNDDIKTFLELS